jgi:hypothetical protein
MTEPRTYDSIIRQIDARRELERIVEANRQSGAAYARRRKAQLKRFGRA